MKKKQYKQPYLQVIELDAEDPITGSTGSSSQMSLFNEKVDDQKRPEYISDYIWGTQW